MTTKELLEKAKAVGGWYVTSSGCIRTKSRNMDGFPACPVYAAVCDVDYDDPFHKRVIEAADTRLSFWAFMVGGYGENTARNRVGLMMRREMESWCK